MEESRQEKEYPEYVNWLVLQDYLTPEDRTILAHKGLEPEYVLMSDNHAPLNMEERENDFQRARAMQNRLAMTIDLMDIRAGEKQAESQDRHSRAMTWLTWALLGVAMLQVFVAVVGAFATAVEAFGTLVQAGVIP